jgi:hypothetical protein
MTIKVAKIIGVAATAIWLKCVGVTANYGELAAKGYRWVIVGGFYGFTSSEAAAQTGKIQGSMLDWERRRLGERPRFCGAEIHLLGSRQITTRSVLRLAFRVAWAAWVEWITNGRPR